MTIRVFRSRRADLEVEEIIEYLAEHNLQAAQRFVEALERAQQQLADFPNSGARGTRPGTRRLVLGT